MSPSSTGRTVVRRLAPAEFRDWLTLFAAYMREAYGAEWEGSREQAQTDLSSARFSVSIAVDAGERLLGFLAWVPSYDLHHTIPGLDVLDLYVVRASRGRGIALQLACAVAADGVAAGARFMKGTALPSGAGSRLYERIAVCDGGACIVSGRAFLRLAELRDTPLRDAIRLLPERSWNYQG